ncbi:MAG: GyrI-like domain-containing protein, partial [Raoultibacter sp.]
VAVPVAKGTQGSRVVEDKTHATATLVGPYEPDAFTAIYAEVCKWIEENSYHMTGAPFDVYVKGGPEVDPKDYITEVYFPIEK